MAQNIWSNQEKSSQHSKAVLWAVIRSKYPLWAVSSSPFSTFLNKYIFKHVLRFQTYGNKCTEDVCHRWKMVISLFIYFLFLLLSSWGLSLILASWGISSWFDQMIAGRFQAFRSHELFVKSKLPTGWIKKKRVALENTAP